MADPLHVQIVSDALANGMGPEHEVSPVITRGELVLFHTLLQDYGLELVSREQFIPLMERSAARLV